MTRSDRYSAWYDREEPEPYHAGYAEVRFRFYVAPAAVLKEAGKRLGPQPSLDDLSAQYEATVAHAATEAWPGVRVDVEPYGGPKTGGPVPDAQYLVEFVNVLNQYGGAIVTVAGLGVLVRAAMRRLQAVTQHDVRVSDGPAMVLAADAIMDATGRRDLALAFVAPLNRYLPALGDLDSSFGGWLVGYRGEDVLYLAVVHEDGTVDLPSGDAPALQLTVGANEDAAGS